MHTTIITLPLGIPAVDPLICSLICCIPVTRSKRFRIMTCMHRVVGVSIPIRPLRAPPVAATAIAAATRAATAAAVTLLLLLRRRLVCKMIKHLVKVVLVAIELQEWGQIWVCIAT